MSGIANIDDGQKSDLQIIETESNEDDYDAIEANRIIQISPSKNRRAEYRSVVQIEATHLLEDKSLQNMQSEYIYGIISNLEEMCEITASRA